MTTKAKVAIIGLGTIGQVLAQNFTKGNRPVILADRNNRKAGDLARTLGPPTQAMDIPAAIQAADIIIFSVWFDAIKELFHTYSAELQGKVIIDPSNPIAPDGNGGFVKKIGEQESAGQLLSVLVPPTATLVKALGTLGAESLQKAAFQSPERAVLFYATDDTHSYTQIEDLIRDAGFEPVHIGSLDQSIRIEVFGDLHEFGGLGKTLTRSEAEKAA